MPVCLPSSDHIFVYGTLMAAATSRMGCAQRQRLAREGRSLGVATMAGRLVDLGSYPGLVNAAKDGDVVHGEIVVLTDPQLSLRWLDDYEEIVPGQHPHNEYVRELREATLASGKCVEAWVYVYQRPFEAANVIESGDWLAYSS